MVAGLERLTRCLDRLFSSQPFGSQTERNGKELGDIQRHKNEGKPSLHKAKRHTTLLRIIAVGGFEDRADLQIRSLP